MSFFTSVSDITITCNSRLSPYLEMEVAELGYEVLERFLTGVRLKGTMNDCIRLNLNLRCASLVLYSLEKFTAQNADEVYEQVIQIPWQTILDKEAYFSVTSTVSNDTINNNMFANLRVKDAIVDKFRNETGKRIDTGSEILGAVIHLFWKQEEAELFINTSGNSLGRHGYRKIPGQAPMLEALSAATILATQWDKKSPFVNPMCGSGTVAIEAALIASNARPGLFRVDYAFMHIMNYDEGVYMKERGILENQIIDLPDLKIIASDYSERAIENAMKNAAAAGVADLITFLICDFEDTEIPDPNEGGVVFLNPEYGDRLGEIEDLEQTYKRIGDFMKQKCAGYKGYIFTGNMELAKKVGLRAKRRIEFYNSKIDCRLLEYELYKGKK